MLCSIDIGSNSIRMLLGEVRNGEIFPINYYRKITRLAEGLSNGNCLSQKVVERTAIVLTDFCEIAKSFQPTRLKAIATHAMREAANGRQVAELLEQRAGLPIEIVDGKREASLCAAGVRSGLSPYPEQCLIFDIGGGSTEFILLQQNDVTFTSSFPVGVVRLAEVGQESDAICFHLVADLLDELSRNGKLDDVRSNKCILVGTAGTVTTLAAMQMNMCNYDWRLVNNFLLNRMDVGTLFSRLKDLTAIQRENLPGVEKGRGDLILPGAHIVLELFNQLHKNSLRVSDFGLLEGVLLSLATDNFAYRLN